MTNCAALKVYNFRMETIYIDRLFILNFICDYLILLGSARVCGVLLRRLRYAVAALFGAAYAVASVFPSFAFLTLLPIKLASGVLMALIAFAKEPKFWRCAAVFSPCLPYSAARCGRCRCKAAVWEKPYIFPFRCPFLCSASG